MALSIHIPNPCLQSWSGMTAKENGRHCDACEKVVVDFSCWEPDEILGYLKNNMGSCGRFKLDQISQPSGSNTANFCKAITQSSWNRLNKIAVFIVYLFLLSSTSTIESYGQKNMGASTVVPVSTLPFVQPEVMGTIAESGDTTSNKYKLLKPFVDSNLYSPKVLNFQKLQDRNKKIDKLTKEKMIMGIIAFPSPKD